MSKNETIQANQDYAKARLGLMDSVSEIEIKTCYNISSDNNASTNTLTGRLPRTRTIKGCHNEIKKLDSETAITECFIRSLCKEGKIIYHLSGNKSLVNLDSLLEYLGYREVS